MLSVRSLNAFYGESQALFEVAIDVPTRGGVAILGRNGAGKSSLLKSVMGAMPRQEGEITWQGRSLPNGRSHVRSRAGLVMVPEDRRIFRHLTVAENLEFGARATGKSSTRKEVAALIDGAVILKGLDERMGDELSGGQQQMVAIARGLMAQPKLLLLDEPTEGLAPIIVSQLAELLRAEMAARDAQLLLAEQNLSFARICTTHVYILDTGRIVFGGVWAEFDSKPELRERYLAV